MREFNPRSEFGIRKAELFNERFKTGDLVAVRRVPGEPASWDRVFAPAYGAGDAAMVELAGSLVPVDTDVVMRLDTRPGDSQREASQACGATEAYTYHFSANVRWWVIALAFVLGFAAAVLLALIQPVRSATPASYGPEVTTNTGEAA